MANIRYSEQFKRDAICLVTEQSYTFTKNSTVEILDTREFNLVNEITDRDLKLGMAPVVAKDPVYDAVGNMTDDGRYYDYKYDAFGRITQVTDSATSTVVAEYKYNGLYNRTITRTDRDSTGGLDSEEYHHIYDDRWRVVEIYRMPVSGSRDTEPKESTLYHAAGVGGSSSPLDSVIARFRSDDDDITGGTPSDDWPVQADGDMNEITWYFQNWRGDVVFINGHGTTERIAYTPYGTPKGYGAGDQNINGAVDAQDSGAWIANFNNGNARADVNFDGTIAGGDFAAWIVEFNTRGGTTGGEGVLSPWLDNHIGYAGYRLTDQVLTAVWHVRYRDFVPEIGLWTRRDPIGYRGGQNLYGYVGMNPIGSIDPMGLLPSPKCGSGCGGGGRGGGRAALHIANDCDLILFVPQLQRCVCGDPGGANYVVACPSGRMLTALCLKQWVAKETSTGRCRCMITGEYVSCSNLQDGEPRDPRKKRRRGTPDSDADTQDGGGKKKKKRYRFVPSIFDKILAFECVARVAKENSDCLSGAHDKQTKCFSMVYNNPAPSTKEALALLDSCIRIYNINAIECEAVAAIEMAKCFSPF